MIYEKLLDHLVLKFPQTVILNNKLVLIPGVASKKSKTFTKYTIFTLFNQDDRGMYVRGRSRDSNLDERLGEVYDFYDIDIREPNALSTIENHIKDTIALLTSI